MSRALYFDVIDCFPPELQNSSAVLYAIVKSISQLHCNNLAPHDERCDSGVSERKKWPSLEADGHNSTFLSPTMQPDESVSTGRCSSILDHFDHVGRRSAQSALIAGESKGIRSKDMKSFFKVLLSVKLTQTFSFLCDDSQRETYPTAFRF